MIRVYADENVDSDIVEGLKRRHVTIWSTAELGRLGADDEKQLEVAVSRRASLLTRDIDLIVIGSRWLREGKNSYGILYANQQKLSIGECIRRVRLLSENNKPADLVNKILFSESRLPTYR